MSTIVYRKTKPTYSVHGDGREPVAARLLAGRQRCLAAAQYCYERACWQYIQCSGCSMVHTSQHSKIDVGLHVHRDSLSLGRSRQPDGESRPCSVRSHVAGSNSLPCFLPI